MVSRHTAQPELISSPLYIAIRRVRLAAVEHAVPRSWSTQA